MKRAALGGFSSEKKNRQAMRKERRLEGEWNNQFGHVDLSRDLNHMIDKDEPVETTIPKESQPSILDQMRFHVGSGAPLPHKMQHDLKLSKGKNKEMKHEKTRAVQAKVCHINADEDACNVCGKKERRV